MTKELKQDMAERSDNSSVSQSPPAWGGSAPGSKRETLTSRAKRIIGRKIDVEEETPSGSGEKPSSKQRARKSPTRRREQVLQAQRTHRQRTQGYIRELEKEVLRLREQFQVLEVENGTLKEVLTNNGLPLPDIPSPQLKHTSQSPADSPPVAAPAHSPASHDGSDSASSGASVTIDLTELNNIEAEKWCSVTAALETTRPFEPPTISPGAINGDLPDPSSLTLRDSSPGHYGATPALSAQAAIDFVLELERPCLPHVKFAHTQDLRFPPLGGRPSPDFNHGPHHVFTTAANLMSSGVSPDPLKAPFNMPIDSLEKLFQTSLSLNLGDDVTPVQIWANIRRIAMKFALDIALLTLLKNEFMKYVRCNSFGTVIHRDTVSLVFDFFFPGEQFLAVWF